MRKKTYNYEKFTTCTELLSEFKNAKKNQKIILGTFSKKLLKIGELLSEFKTWPLKALNLLLLDLVEVG